MQVLGRLVHARIIPRDPHQLPAEHSLGRHGCAEITVLIAVQAAVPPPPDMIQPYLTEKKGLLRNLDSNCIRAVQGHDLPPEDGGIRALKGFVAPTAVGDILRAQNEANCPLKRLA